MFLLSSSPVPLFSFHPVHDGLLELPLPLGLAGGLGEGAIDALHVDETVLEHKLPSVARASHLRGRGFMVGTSSIGKWEK